MASLLPTSHGAAEDALQPQHKVLKASEFEVSTQDPVVQPMLLDGASLEPPRHHPVAWYVGQRFSEADDPDRMKEAWEAPMFVATKDPVSQRPRTTVEELQLPEGCRAKRSTSAPSFARVVHNVLEPRECAEVLAAVNKKGFTPALVNIGSGMQIFEPGYRDSSRCVVDSSAFSAYLLEVIRPHLPALWRTKPPPNGRERNLIIDELNERCRFLVYHRRGQSFAAHFDGSYVRPDDHPKAGARSTVTVQLYFHDVPEAHGGATTFLDASGGAARDVRCQPRCGSVLLFTQDLYHEGSKLFAGVKYTLRTEVMYRAPPDEQASRKDSEGGQKPTKKKSAIWLALHSR